MADSAIILFVKFLLGLIFYFEKLGQRDLNKKIIWKFPKNVF